MNLKSIIVLFLIGIYLAISVHADTMQFSIYTHDGDISTYQLKDNPKIEVKKNYLIIYNKSIEISFQLSNLEKLIYQSSQSGVNLPQKMEKQSALILNDDDIIISPLQNDNQLCVYNTNGILLESRKIEANQSHKISISSLNSGLYIITLNNNTYKIWKK
ncbi:MAG: T9SS type A sorting domain-containing protein [Muribaculaceae bacterium]|nr:T9SS type A sorting domain-containing protein [Muribaculaceae bacterium]